MGSGEGKERSRRRSKSPSSDSDSSPERKHKKSKKEHKHKHKSQHKKHKKHSSEVDEQQLAAAKAFLAQHLQQTAGGEAAAGSGAAAAALAAAAAAGGGGGGGKSSKSSSKGREKPAGELPADVDPLTADDYFERSAEFTLWLQETRNQYFNELTSDQTHAAFRDFVLAWNSGRLPLRYYTGLTAAPLKRTSHNWGFKAKQQGSGAAAAAAAGKTGMAAYLSDQQEQRAGERVAAAAERRHQRKEQKELLDELLPRATAGTREARVEARMARRAEAKAREDSPDLMAAGGANIMGGGDSFAAAKAREAQRQDWRTKQQAAKKEELAHKLSAAAQAEADKMAQFKALVAAQGGKISIPKRQ